MYTLKGLTLAELGLVIAPNGIGDAWSPPRLQRQSVAVTGRYGRIPIGESAGESSTVALELPLPSTISARRALLDTVLGHLDGIIEVVADDATDRVRFGYVDQAAIRERFAQLPLLDYAGHLSLSIEILFDRPVSYAKESSVLAVGSTPVVVPLGTAPSDSIFLLRGSFSGATITYRRLTGEPLASLVLSGAVDTDEYLEVRSDQNMIVFGDSTGAEYDMSFYSSGSFIILDPGDGDPSNVAGPTVECDVPAILIHRKAYL
jgi:hypothetical protein